MSESMPPTPPTSPTVLPHPPAIYVQAPAPAKSSGVKIFFRVLFWVLLGLSVVMNVSLICVVGMGVMGGQIGDQAAMAQTVLSDGSASETVAVYRVRGVIDQDAVAGFRRFFDSVVSDDDVRAVVLRVSSPGGGVASSNEIHQMVKGLQAAGKTVVVSMGSVAASGGYMISCSADHIVAEPGTITGSIGVIMTWMVLDGTFDKLGIQPVVIKSTDADYWKDDVSLMHLPDERQVAYLRDILDKMQQQFADSVRQGRGAKLVAPTGAPARPLAEGEVAVVDPEANAPLNGKVYIADDALEVGLIDQIGYRQDAFDRAASLAGLSNPKTVLYSHKPVGLFTVLFGATHDSPVTQGVDILEDLQTPKFMAKFQME